MKTSDIAPISLSRRELYDLVWTVPVPEAAARLGISRTWLTKICSRARVPYPTRAWWALVAAGKAPARARLGQVKVEDVIILRPRGRVRPGPPLGPRDPGDGPHGEAAHDAAHDLAHPIGLPDRLTRLHPVLTAWRSEIWHELERQRREPWRKPAAAPADLTKRRLRLLDAILKALERRGHRVEPAGPFDGRLILLLDRRRLEFVLREVPAPEPPAAPSPSPETPPSPEAPPSPETLAGKPWLVAPPHTALSLEIRLEPESAWPAPAPAAARWGDRPGAGLEDQLPDILAALSRLASAPAGHAPAAAAAAFEPEPASASDAAPALSDPEALAWLALNRLAAAWEATDRIRRYLDSLATAPAAAPTTEAQRAWLAWAQAQLAARAAGHADLERAMAATEVAAGEGGAPWAGASKRRRSDAG